MKQMNEHEDQHRNKRLKTETRVKLQCILNDQPKIQYHQVDAFLSASNHRHTLGNYTLGLEPTI